MREDALRGLGGPREPITTNDASAPPDAARVYCGVLKWFDVTRGFGFLVSDESGVGDILVHFTAVRSSR